MYGPIPAGSSTMRVPFCENFTSLTVPGVGRFQFVLSINSIDACRVGFDVIESIDHE